MLIIKQNGNTAEPGIQFWTTIHKYILFTTVLLLSFHMSAQEINKDILAIDAVLAKQVKAWNEGNLNEFMEGYWPSDSLKFIGKEGISHGWKKTLENYKKRYPNKAAMGILEFEIISKENLDKNYYLVIGKWHLQRKADELGGHFSLIWKCINGQWLIIADHSS